MKKNIFKKLFSICRAIQSFLCHLQVLLLLSSTFYYETRILILLMFSNNGAILSYIDRIKILDNRISIRK